MSEPMATIRLTIDDKEVEVPKGTTVYQACRKIGLEIPIFCYQDRMPPFGACRVCLVEVEKMPRLQTSCTLVAEEGMVVRTQSEGAVDGRKSTLEFLLINHPLDCPICDRGGECPLQDQALKFGPGKSEFFEEKRHFSKAKPLGSVLMLDRERCIICARCTRFGDVIAGDHALEFKDRGYKTEVGTPGDAPPKSKFIGNTIEICPVGALTSQVYRFRARPWDNLSTKSICPLCPVGCNLNLDSRDGEIMRTRSDENKSLNDMWLCDKGWFGYEFTSSPDRLTHPLIRKQGRLTKASWTEALDLVAENILKSRAEGRIAGWGGNALTIEENYFFQKLIRDGAGVQNVDHRIGMSSFDTEEEGLLPGMEISLGDCEELSFAILLGFDVTEEFPLVWLRLKQGINKGTQVSYIGHYTPEIASNIAGVILHEPGKEMQQLKVYLPEIAALAGSGKKGAIFVGRQYLNTSSRRFILSQLLKLREALPNISLNIMEGSSGSLGARLAGMHPEKGPLGRPLHHGGLSAIEVLKKSASSGWDLLYVAGANPASHFPKNTFEEARRKLRFLVVQDLFLTETARVADVVLPTLSFVEKSGSFLNIEGRIQKLAPGKDIPEDILGDAEIFKHLGSRIGLELLIDPDMKKVLEGPYFHFPRAERLEVSQAPKLSSAGETYLLASFVPALFDKGVRMKHGEHISKLARPPFLSLHHDDAYKRDFSDGEKVRLERVDGSGRSVIGTLRLDAGIARGTILVPLGFDELPARELGPDLINGMKLELKPY